MDLQEEQSLRKEEEPEPVASLTFAKEDEEEKTSKLQHEQEPLKAVFPEESVQKLFNP